jgi:hypothetical protein
MSTDDPKQPDPTTLTYPPVINGHCAYCGRHFEDDFVGNCPSANCPSHDPPYEALANWADRGACDFEVQRDDNGKPQVRRGADGEGAHVLGWKWVEYSDLPGYPLGCNPSPPTVTEP